MYERLKEIKSREITVIGIIILLLLSFLLSIYSLNRKTTNTDTRSAAELNDSFLKVTGGGTFRPGEEAVITLSVGATSAYNAIAADMNIKSMNVTSAIQGTGWSPLAAIVAPGDGNPGDPTGTILFPDEESPVIKIYPKTTIVGKERMVSFVGAKFGTGFTGERTILTLKLKMPETAGSITFQPTGSLAFTNATSANLTGNAITFTVATPTNTPVPTATKEPTPTATKVPTPTATKVPTPTATKVPTPTVTKVPTPTVTKVPTPTATSVPTSTKAPTPTAVTFKSKGDLNNDRKVTVLDLSILAKFWCPRDFGTPCKVGFEQADINDNNYVDTYDVSVLAENWLKNF